MTVSSQKAALRSIWREAAEKRIEHGIDWPRVVLDLFRDIDELERRVEVPELEELAEAAYRAAMGTRSDPDLPYEPWTKLPHYWRRIYRAQAAAIVRALGIEVPA